MNSEATKPKLRIHVENHPKVSSVYHITPDILGSALSKFGSQVDVTYGKDPAGFSAKIADAEILVTGHEIVTDPGLSEVGLATLAPRLKWVQSTSAGVEKLARFIPPNVFLTNASGVHEQKGGEYAIAAVLMLNSGVPRFMTAQRASRWEKFFTTPANGKTLVIVGLGSIGTAAARHAKQFEMRVIGVTRSGQSNDAVDKVVSIKNLNDVLPNADFLLLVLPLTDATRGLIGQAQLDLLPRHAGLINIGRGPVLDHVALARKLSAGELSGAVLDVLPEEPLPSSSPLWSTPNLIISPHCALDDASGYAMRAARIFVDNLQRYVDGSDMINVVDTRLGY